MNYHGGLIFTLSLLLMAIISLHATYLIKKRRFLLFDPLNMFWAGFLVVYVMQSLELSTEISEKYTRDVIMQTLLWCAVSAVCVIAGYESGLGKRVSTYVPRMPSEPVRSRFLVIAAGIFLAAVLGIATKVSGAGGLDAWASVGRGGQVYAGLSPILNIIIQFELFLHYGAILLLFYAYMYPVPRFTKTLIWSAVIFTVLYFFYVGTRSRTIIMAAGILGATHLPRRKNPSLALVLPAVFAVLCVVPLLAAYRGHFTGLSFNLDKIDFNEAVEVATPNFLKSKDQVVQQESTPLSGQEINCTLAIFNLVPDKFDYNYGYPLLQIFTQPIPRGYWYGGKIYPMLESFTPIMAEANLSQAWNYTGRVPFLMGPAFGFVGYWWAAGGPIALILASFVTGILFRTLRNIYEREPGNKGDMMLMMMLAPLGFFEAASVPLFFLVNQPIQFIGIILAVRFSGTVTQNSTLIHEHN